MIGAVFPETRAMFFDLIDGTEHAGVTVAACYQLPYPLEDSLPQVLLYTQRATEGYVDRTEWLTVTVYAAPGEAVPILESIRAGLVDRPHDTDSGFIDDVVCEQAPQDVPYMSDLIMQASATFRVTSRPQ